MKAIIVIPARLRSTRLPDKVILDLAGKPVIQWVYEACLRSKLHQEVWIAADSKKVFDICREFTANVIMTDPDHPSGTDRIAEVAANIPCDMVINVQGDEPFFDATIVDRLISALQTGSEVMASVCAPIQTIDELNNPNLVKVVTDINNNAVYFSRFAIPYARDWEIEDVTAYKKHMGVYVYRADFLADFVKLPVSFLEATEKLEQLRAIENGYKIKMIEVEDFEKGIDTPEDLEAAIKKLTDNGTI
ncbi:3-deoxy-manno-octulosonate cytidylyltransferase [Mucilaginibacter segetis]|uniref:3-deoxy-manno-octulosonate cytidylyltransferase n=1 Tax=Mucilaginibacter segetis TaxID=2793071 RepID=A0A934PP57_9SPHI|nr:3-deoxy-manno-octulosonate cytidylyltransferase [Mucilaginibacter segetis]MBK0378138.1 3-deoxy-manno-octulosonate cytidylyltransferase [Mucilaginibacter segetis]